MQRWKKCALLLVLAGPAAVLPSCGTILASSLRDAAVDGAASFVEVTTTDLLDRLLGPTLDE